MAWWASLPSSCANQPEADGIITGLAKIDGDDLAVVSFDFTASGGEQGRLSHCKIDGIQRWVMDNCTAVLYLCSNVSAIQCELAQTTVYPDTDEKGRLIANSEFLSHLREAANYTAPRKPAYDPYNRAGASLTTIITDTPRSRVMREHRCRQMLTTVMSSNEESDLCVEYLCLDVERGRSRRQHPIILKTTGSLDTPASDKIWNFTNVCDASKFPLVFLAVMSGFVYRVEANCRIPLLLCSPTSSAKPGGVCACRSNLRVA